MDSEYRFSYGKLFLIGLGFFSISLVWAIFNSYVPIFLKGFIASSTVVGLIMVLDNLAGMSLQPWFSALSDGALTRIGRRMPFLCAGMPLAALFFVLLPLHSTLFTLVVTIVAVDVSMSLFRGPTVALMPDFTPSPLRSKANGIINFMGGLGAVAAFGLGSVLYGMNKAYPFIFAAALMIISLLLLLLFAREPIVAALNRRRKGMSPTGEINGGAEAGEGAKTRDLGSIKTAFLEVVRSQDKSKLFVLLAIFSWFIAWNGAETWFTSYGKYFIGIPEEQASFMLTFFSLSFLVFAIPSGFIATRFGRKNVIRTGLIGMALMFVLLYLTTNLLFMMIILAFGGLCWALININSYPMVADMAGEGKLGSYTGLYYFFSSTAAVVAPPIFGFFIDIVGFPVLFGIGFLALVAAFYFMSKVESGEVVVAGSDPGVTL